MFRSIILCLLLIPYGMAFGQPGPQVSESEYNFSIPEYLVLYDFEISGKNRMVGPGDIELQLRALNKKNLFEPRIEGVAKIQIDGKDQEAVFTKGIAKLTVPVQSSGIVGITITGVAAHDMEVTVVPGWLSLLPPLIAIAMALLFKEVVVALLMGIFSGVLIYTGFSPENWLVSFFTIVDGYIVPAMMDTGHLSIIVFSTMIGGMVAVISKNGGMAGIVEKLSVFARSGRSGQLITWLLGIVIFFDDYANTLIVGNTMRSVTDRFKISREKLAYLVDSTAAPVASIAFVTTWIGVELGYIKDAIENLGIHEGAYSIFINSLQYSFYPVFTLFFIIVLIYTRKDFGPMLKAEKRAKETGILNLSTIEKADGQEEFESSSKAYMALEGIRYQWYNAFIPVSVVIIVTMTALYLTGLEASAAQLRQNGFLDMDGEVWPKLGKLVDGDEASFFRKLGIIIGNADAYKALLWASFSGLALAVLLTISQRIMNIYQTMETMMTGFRTMLTAVLILILAWSLSKVTEDINTARFLTSVFSGNLSPAVIPSIAFIMSGVIAFSTGTSWGTMAILYPLLLPATWAICGDTGLEEAATMNVMYHVTSVVLAGSVLGDHCSPISDTTILSSLASDCNHVEHVKTQLPYAITVGSISLFCSLILVNIGLPWWVNYGIGFVAIILIVYIFGKKP